VVSPNVRSFENDRRSTATPVDNFEGEVATLA
jgi:hypothetical protein